MKSFRIAVALLAAGMAFACKSPPERQSPCRTQPGEGELSIECSQPDDEWSKRAEEEAVKGMQERSPENRP